MISVTIRTEEYTIAIRTGDLHNICYHGGVRDVSIVVACA